MHVIKMLELFELSFESVVTYAVNSIHISNRNYFYPKRNSTIFVGTLETCKGTPAFIYVQLPCILSVCSRVTLRGLHTWNAVRSVTPSAALDHFL